MMELQPILFEQKQQFLTVQERDFYKDKEQTVDIKGDVFTYEGVNFKTLSENDLENEEIKDVSLSSLTSSDKQVDDRVVVAFRDPQDKENIITLKLERDVFNELKNSFSSDNFFNRKDGIVRLNKDVEKYIAGWMLDIKENRGYDQADKDGNGFINEAEKDNLRVAFDHKTEYSYLKRKVVEVKTAVGDRTYQKLGDTTDKITNPDAISTRSAKFENTVEKELSHTLKLDKDKDGSITLEETLVDFTPKDTTVKDNLIKVSTEEHIAWINKEHPKLHEFRLEVNSLSTQDIQTEEEMRKAWDKMIKHSKKSNDLFEQDYMNNSLNRFTKIV